MVVAADDLLIAVSQVEIQAAGKQPRVSIIAYSGGVMSVPGWGPVAIDLTGLDASGRIALLADHDATVGGVVGHGTAVQAGLARRSQRGAGHREPNE